MNKIKHFTLFFASLSLALNTFAAPVCSLNSSDNVDDLNAVIDETKDCKAEQAAADALCVERKIDENAVRERISKNLDEAQGKFDEFKNRFNGSRSSSQLNDLFRQTNPYYSSFFRFEPAYDGAAKWPTPVLAWINDNKFTSSTEDADTLKKAFIEKYVQFAKKMDCNPQITTETSVMELSKPQKVSSKGKQSYEYERAVADFKRDIAKPENIQADRDEVARFNSHASESLTTCSPNLYSPEERTIVSYTFPGCAGNFKQYFADNQYKISKSSLDQIMQDPNSKNLADCIKSAVARGAKINHISISASANSLNNGGEAARKFCPKGFRGLSNARAESARDVILPAVFEGSAVDYASVSSLVNINDSGANGNGTSGPCVYTKDASGHETVKPEVLKALNLADQHKINPKVKIDPASQEILDSLDAAKNVSVQVTFDENTVGAKENSRFYSAMVSCRSIKFSCVQAAK
ncbi:MAG: hypothetical protein ACXVAX_10130 [Pseudobdellovibrio sp.]